MLNMTPKKVTHVRICDRLLSVAQLTTENQRIVKITNPVKA